MDDWDNHRLECGQSQKYMQNTSKYLLDTLILPDKSILQLISRYDAAETLSCPEKWPRSFSCDIIKCPKCKGNTTALVNRKQKNNSDKKLLVTKIHVLEIEILSRKCKKCSLNLSPDTLTFGLLNIGDTTLVSLDIFYSLRNLIRCAFMV